MIGDLILVHNEGWLFDQIRAISKCEYDHIAIQVTENLIVEATPTKGVKVEPLLKYNCFKKKVLRLKDQSAVAKMVEFSLARTGSKYDYLNLVRLYLKVLFHTKRSLSDLDIHGAFICVELVSKSASYAGFNFNEATRHANITMAHILGSDKIELVA